MKKILYIVTLVLLIGLVLGYKELYNYQNLISQLLKENNNLQNNLKEHKSNQKVYSQNNEQLNNKITNLKNKIIYLEDNITNLKNINNIIKEENIKLEEKLNNIDKIIIVPEINYSIETENNIKDLNFTEPKKFEYNSDNKTKDDISSFTPTLDVDMEEKAVKGFHINYTNKF